jgi:hypothetical protein
MVLNESKRAKRYTDKGHKLVKNSLGEIDWFALEEEFHNGPACQLCGMSWCDHCEEEIPQCKGIGVKDAAPA